VKSRFIAAFLVFSMALQGHAVTRKKDPDPAAAPSKGQSADSFTLKECVDLAIAQSEQLKIVREDYNRADALFR
jgi:hypothetical protein